MYCSILSILFMTYFLLNLNVLLLCNNSITELFLIIGFILLLLSACFNIMQLSYIKSLGKDIKRNKIILYSILVVGTVLIIKFNFMTSSIGFIGIVDKSENNSDCIVITAEDKSHSIKVYCTENEWELLETNKEYFFSIITIRGVNYIFNVKNIANNLTVRDE